MADIPDVRNRADGTISIDYGQPGPFLVLSRWQVTALLVQLHVRGIADMGHPRWPWNRR